MPVEGVQRHEPTQHQRQRRRHPRQGQGGGLDDQAQHEPPAGRCHHQIGLVGAVAAVAGAVGGVWTGWCSASRGGLACGSGWAGDGATPRGRAAQAGSHQFERPNRPSSPWSPYRNANTITGMKVSTAPVAGCPTGPGRARPPHQLEDAVDGADAEQVEQHRLGRQQQRAERTGQQQEGDHGDGYSATGIHRRVRGVSDPTRVSFSGLRT
jgi:hypothetical protein